MDNIDYMLSATIGGGIWYAKYTHRVAAHSIGLDTRYCGRLYSAAGRYTRRYNLKDVNNESK